MGFKRVLSMLILVGILIMGIPLPINAAVSRQVWVEKEGMFPFDSDGSSQNVTLTIDIPNLVSVTGKYTDNGIVNCSVLGNTVTVNLSGGTYYSTPVKGSATATETFSFKSTDSTVSKSVSSNRKVLQVMGHTMGSTVSSVVADSNPNFLKFSLVPGTGNKVQDTGNILSYYDTIELNDNKAASVSVENKSYAALPYLSSISCVETPYISNGSVTTSISSDKTKVSYNFSGGTAVKEIEKNANGNPLLISVAERGWVWLTQWFDGVARWFTTYYIDPNNSQQIIPYDTEIIPGYYFDSSQNAYGQSIKDLLVGKVGYEDGVRRTFNVSSYVNSDWTYIVGYKLNTDLSNTIHTEGNYSFALLDGVTTDFYNTTIDTVHYNSSGLLMGIYSDVHFKGDQIFYQSGRKPTEDPRIEQHYQLKYGAGFSILRGRNIYNYKAQAKINYYPYTYNYSGTVTYKYETETSQTGYIYNGYIKAKYRSLETVLDQPPTAPTDIVLADKRQISWLPATDDYTPRSSLKYDLYYKNTSGTWTLLAGSKTGYTQEPPVKIQYTHTADIPAYTDGLIYLRIDAVDDAGQKTSGYNDPNIKLILTGSLNKTTAVQDETLNISALTKSTPDATGVSFSLASNAGTSSGALTRTARIPDKTITYFTVPKTGVDTRYSMWGAYQTTGATLLQVIPGYVDSIKYGSKFYGWGASGTDESFEIGTEGTLIIPRLNNQDPGRLGEMPPPPTTIDSGWETFEMNLRTLPYYYSSRYWLPGYTECIQIGTFLGNNPATNYLISEGWVRSEYKGKYVVNKTLFTGSIDQYAYFDGAPDGFLAYKSTPGMIIADVTKPLALSWKDGRMKVMQPGAVLYDGLMGTGNFFNVPTNRLHGPVNEFYGHTYIEDANEIDWWSGDYVRHEYRLHQIGVDRYTLSRTQWTLQDVDNFYNNLYYGRENNWYYWSFPSYGINAIHPIMDDYLPAASTWSGSIKLPHNIKNGNYTIKLSATNGSSTSSLDLPFIVNTPIDLTGTVPGTLEGGKSYTAEAYTSQYVDNGGVILNIFGTNYTMTKSGAFEVYVAGKQKWIYTFTVPALQTPGTYDAETGAFAKAKFTAALPGGDSQNTSTRFNVLAPLSSITGVNLAGYVGDILPISVTTSGFASSAWVEIPGVPSINLTPASATTNNTNTWTGSFAVPFNFTNGTQNIIYKSSNSRGVGTISTKTITIGTRITVTGSVGKPAYITWAAGIPAGEKLDISTTVTTLPDISKIEYITPWFSGTIPLGKKTGSTTVSSIVTPQKLPAALADGNYSVTIRVTTVNGVTAETNLPFTVYTPISVTGDNVTVPTDEDFKLSCTVTGVIPSMNSITAQVAGTLITTGGTLANPAFNLTYNPITGKYESPSLKLLMTSSAGNFTITYRAATTNSNVSTSARTLTVTTNLSLIGNISPATIYAGGNVVATATVNKWVKSVTVNMPQGTITLDPALKKSNGDGTYTYTQTITIPGTVSDKTYNAVFTASSHNNTAALTSSKALTVSTPITVTGDNITTPTDTNFKLSCTAAGALAAMNSITAQVTGTLYTTGGTLTNPIFNLTYNAVSGKYESTSLNLLMTQNTGSLPIVYRASTTNGNVSTSSRTLTITTPMTLTAGITPSTIHARGNIVISATVNRWVKNVTVSLPLGIITMDPAFKASNGDGTFTYTQDVTIPGGQADGNYNVVFTANAYNNASAITVAKPLTVSTPITIVGDNIITPTDENFKLSGTVTGSLPAISTVTAQVTGTLQTTGGTLTNPAFTLTYNALTGKYESNALKLLMTQNTGSYPVTYRAATTNGNMSASSKSLTVTTILDFTPSISPATVIPGGTIDISAVPNKWIKEISVTPPGGSVTLNASGAYTRQFTVPATTSDNSYTVTFTGKGYNNAANLVKALVLNVFTPLSVTASVTPSALPASEAFTIDAWVDTPIGINSVTYTLSGPYGSSGQLGFISRSGNVSHYKGTYTIDKRHPDGSFNVNVTAALVNARSAAVNKPININTPVNIEPYINGQNTGCEIFSGQINTLSACTTRFPGVSGNYAVFNYWIVKVEIIASPINIVYKRYMEVVSFDTDYIVLKTGLFKFARRQISPEYCYTPVSIGREVLVWQIQ